MKAQFLIYSVACLWTSVAFGADAAVVEVYNCGTNCQATLYSDGVFRVKTENSGVGSMNTYTDNNRKTTAPWSEHLSDIKEVVIEEGIQNVGGYTFNGATNLTNVELPESVKSIGIWAFLESGLKTVNTLKNVNTISAAAFYYTQLESADLSENLKYIADDAFTHTKLTSIIIPDGVTSIGLRAFHGCWDLEEIIIPDKVKTIQADAFVNLPANAKIYCQDTAAHQCDTLINSVTGGSNKVVKYSKEGDRYVLNGQKYKSLSDLQKGQPVKRIYSVEEATAATKDVNRITIRYR